MMKHILVTAIVLALAPAAGLAAAAADTESCGRACLIDTLDRYLAALTKQDAGSAPLAAGVRMTENAIDVAPGEGLWRTASGLGKLQRRYADPVSGQAAYFGVIEERDGPALASLRLKIDGRKVTEAEWIIARKGAPLFNLDGAIADAPSDRPIASRLRSGREAMVAAADSYFQGLQDHSGVRVLSHQGCVRVENGTMVTSRPGEPQPAAPAAAGNPANAVLANEFGRGDCATNLERMTQIAAVVERRYPVVDEEAGVVLGSVVFHRPPGAKRNDGTPWPRLLLSEFFPVENGRIRGIYAAMHYLPSDGAGTSGWVKADQPSVTRGRAMTSVTSLYNCAPVPNARIAGIGTITALDGQRWTVPADVDFANGPKAADLYNECSGVVPQSFDPRRADSVPVVEVDADGEVITGYLLADNYFELYVNGKLIGVDAVPFTPFNSAVVRFRAKRPVTYAVKLVDWEEHLGLGSEKGGPQHPFHPGDGGFVARFSDGTVTDASWKAQTFYVAPLDDPGRLVVRGSLRDSSSLGTTLTETNTDAACSDQCYAVHFPLPGNWAAPGFDDSHWPAATVFPDEQMGLDRLPAYLKVREAFGEGRAIWSSNLVFDNLVIARKTGNLRQ
ncbi:MAG: hypothetical protein QM696_14035 [Steroidobacteraceae bacterium]